MDPIIARRSIRQYSWAFVVAFAIALVAHRLGLSGGGSLILGLLLAAGPTAFGLARAVFGQDEILRIDESGITDRRLGIGPIPWEQISSIQNMRGRLFVSIKGPKALGIEKTLWRRMNQPLGQRPETFGVFVSLRGLTVPADTIVAAINDRLRTAGDISVTV